MCRGNVDVRWSREASNEPEVKSEELERHFFEPAVLRASVSWERYVVELVWS